MRRHGVQLRGFTLLELIVVMVLLSAMFAIAVPRLSNTMRGRTSVEEARRLAALTRFARTEAINRAERMELWINPDQRTYGLRSETATIQGYADSAGISYEYELADRLTFDYDPSYLNDRNEIVILFWPDGTMDMDAPERIALLEDGKPWRELLLDENGFQYEIVDPNART